MADVFISYSKLDRAVAEALSVDLKVRGLELWWDHELYAGEDFHSAIIEEINRTKAVVVIWSESAVASRWVRGEADHAAGQAKLVSTHVAGFDLKQLPLNFRSLHSDDVTDRDRVFRAVERMGARPARIQRPEPINLAPPVQHWSAQMEVQSVTRSIIVIKRQGEEHVLEVKLNGVYLDGLKIAELQASTSFG